MGKNRKVTEFKNNKNSLKKIDNNIRESEKEKTETKELSTEELFTFIDNNEMESEKIVAPKYSYWQSVFRVFFRKKINIVVLTLLGIIILMAYVYPLFVSSDQYDNILNAAAKHLSPSKAIEQFGFSLHNILGRGASGESTFDALWYGSRISLSLAFICAAINMTVGVLVGAIWGFSKKFDKVMIEIYNIISNIPGLVLVAVLAMLFTASFWTMVFAMTVTGWLGIAFFIRTQVIIIRDREYNMASKCLGTGMFKICLKNILPYMTSVIVTLLATEIPSYIDYEVFLSYIGMGISDRSLGKMIYQAQSAMVTPGWHFEFWSPVVIAGIITVVLYLVGQNLGDASDPRTHI